jgi:hypothetical protein
MYDMLRQGTGVNFTIVKVYEDEFLFHWLQDAIHHAHELAGCVCQAIWQDSPLVQVKFSGKGPLLSVSCCNMNLVATSCQVQWCKSAGAVHGVE